MAGAQEPGLVETLQACFAHNTRARAEDHLDTLMRDPSNLETMFQIVGSPDVSLDCRLLAVICLRNHVNRHWRISMPTAVQRHQGDRHGQIPDNVKAKFKEVLLAMLAQGDILNDLTLIKQVALLVAKVARFELRTWPELVPVVMQGLQKEQSSPIMLLRYLVTLHFVLIEALFASKIEQREPFYQLCGAVSGPVVQLCSQYNRKALAEGSSEAVMLCCYCHKVMLRVLRGGVSGNRDVSAGQYVAETSSFIESLMNKRMEVAKNHVLTATLDKLLQKSMKALAEPYLLSPQGYNNPSFLKSLLSLATRAVVAGDPDKENLPAAFLMRCLSVVEQVIAASSSSEVAKAAFSEVLSSNVQTFLSVLLNKYLCVHSSELELWEADPEAFVFEKGDIHDDALCEVVLKEKAASVFVGLTDECGDQVMQEFTGTVERIFSTPLPGDAVATEAALYVMGLGCYTFPRFINDDMRSRWLQVSMSLATRHPNKMARRRAIWVLGQWVYEVPAENFLQVCKLLVSLQSDASNDLVIRLTAVNAFKEYVVHAQSLSTELDSNEFAGLLPAFFTSIVSILGGCSNSDLKHSILDLITLVVQTVDASIIVPHCPQLAELLHTYWKHEQQSVSKGQTDDVRNMTQIFVCLRAIVMSVGHVPAIYHLACSVIDYATDTKNACYLELIDNSCELWYEVTLHAVELTESLSLLFPRILVLFDKAFSAYDYLVRVAHQYLLLGGLSLLQAYGAPLFSGLLKVLQTMKDEPLTSVCDLVDDFLVMFPNFSRETVPVVSFMLQTVLEKSEAALCRVAYIAIVCRLIVVDKQLGMQVIASFGKTSAFIDQLIDLEDAISRRDHRKVAAMAAVALCTPPDPEYLQHIDCIMSIVVDATLGEEGEEAQYFRLSVLESRCIENETEYNKVANDRKMKVLETDPVMNTSMRDWLARCLAELQSQLGAQYPNVIKTVGEHNRKPLNI